MNTEEQMQAAGAYDQIDEPLLNLLLLSDLTQKLVDIMAFSSNTADALNLDNLLLSNMEGEKYEAIKDHKAVQQTKGLRDKILARNNATKDSIPKWMDMLDRWFFIIRPMVIEVIDSIEVVNDEMLATYRYRTTEIKLNGTKFVYKTIVEPNGDVLFDDTYINELMNPEPMHDTNVGRLFKLLSSIAIFDTLTAVHEGRK